MTIRSDYQAEVDAFIGDLHEFATGSYLSEGETDLWEEPFDPAALPDLKNILERMLDGLEVLPDDPPGDALAQVVNAALEQMRMFNEKHENAVIEPEELAELRTLIFDASAATGATEDALAELPEIELQ